MKSNTERKHYVVLSEPYAYAFEWALKKCQTTDAAEPTLIKLSARARFVLLCYDSFPTCMVGVCYLHESTQYFSFMKLFSKSFLQFILSLKNIWISSAAWHQLEGKFVCFHLAILGRKCFPWFLLMYLLFHDHKKFKKGSTRKPFWLISGSRWNQASKTNKVAAVDSSARKEGQQSL